MRIYSADDDTTSKIGIQGLQWSESERFWCIVFTDERTTQVSRKVLRGFRPERFSAARKALNGMSAADLARLCSRGGLDALPVATVSDVTIRRWEEGTTSPTIDKLARTIEVMRSAAKELDLDPVQVTDVIVTVADERFLSDYRHLVLMTQPQLAKAAGVQTSLLKRIERGERPLSKSIEESLARVLNISVAEVQAAHERARLRPPGLRA